MRECFEHVDDWKRFISDVSKWLNKGAMIIILCPNYSFPYEPHFRIPILFNKVITYKLFHNYIDDFERKNKTEGLRESLNFVTKRKLFKYVNNIENIKIFDDVSIIDEMIIRATNDIEFRKRQKMIGIIASFLSRIGFIKLLKKVPLFLPYMKIEIMRIK